MRKNMSKALAVSLSIALAAGNTPIGTRYVSAQENPAVWEAQTTAEGEAVTSGRSVEEDTGTNVGGETEETTEVSSEKKEDTSGTVTTENKTEDLQGATTEGKSETSTTEGAEEASTETQPEETEQPEEEPVVSFTQGEDTTNYRNFKEAWETASVTGGTLTLCQNVEASELLEASSDITLNLNGYELSGSIEVTAGTLYVTDTSENGGGLLFNPSGTAVAVTGGALDIANARITGTDSVINITGGALNITNAQITGKDSAINVYNGTVNIDKDTVISAEGNAVNLITPYSKNNEEDNSVDINSMDSNSMDLTVSGGSITSTEGAAVREYLDTSESQDGEEIIWHTNISNITIKDGTFSGKGKALDFSDSLVKEESVLNITGGTFSSDIKEYLSSAYTTNKTEDGQYIVSERENPVKEDLKYNLEDVTYDGKTHPVKVSSEKALGAIKVLYNGKEEMPVNARTYEVSVEIAESNNYYSGQFDLGSFQITKAETSVNLTVALTNEREHVEENTIGYFGDEVTMTASVAGVEGETLEGSVAFYDGETELKTVPLENNSAQFKTSELTAQTHEITAKYIPAEEANYKGSVSEKVAANIAEVKETGIEVTTQPAKTTYTDSETFNPEGMIVTAHYNNGSTKEVEDYTVDTTTKLTVDTTKIQITHADNYTASVPVTVDHDTNYRYEKNEAGNTLTKKCGGCDEIFGTMSIAAPESMELDRENGNPAVLTVTGDISASEVSITYASLTGADISTLAPTKAGTYTATATYNNQTVTVRFTLIISVTGVTANEVYALKVGDSANLSKKIAPEDATNQDVIWKSDNENIVTVDENGKITAVAEGEANITVTTKDQNKTATCKIYAMPQDAKFGKCGDNAWWKFNDGVFTVWGNGAVTDTKDFSAYKTKTTSVVVEKGITEVGGFYGFTALENIEIMDGVEKIKESAFKSCKNLKQIELPESITKIGQDAFRDCTGVSYIKIGSPKCEYASGFGVFSGMGSSEGVTVEFGEKVTEIPRLMLGAQVRTVKFDGKVKKIGNYAFYGWSNLGEIELPESVEEIGNGAFIDCAKLSSITVGENVTKIGSAAFNGCRGLKKVIMNARLEEENAAFETAGNGEMEVIYGQGITKIGRLFCGSKIQKVEIPEGVETIEESAFKSCKNLKQIELPESITKIGQDAFRDCTGVSYIKIGSPKCEYASGFGVFSGMGSSEGVTVEFGEKVTEIPRLMLGAQVRTVKFDGKVKKIGNYAFYGWSNLGEIELPESVEEIGNGAFVGCAKLSSITLGSNITTIGYNAFYGLTNLTTVTLPSKLKDIAGNAFANCKNLKEYIVSDENKDLSAKDGVLYGKDETELISYPAGKDDQTEFDMLSMNVDTIREGAFDGNTALKSVKIGDDVQTIGEEAFANVSDALTLHVYKNSYADEYAKENEVPVEYLSEEVEEGTPVFRGASLSLAGTILINYYIEFPEDVKDGRVEFDLVDDSGKTKSKVTATLKDASKETITSGGKQYEYYKYSVSLTAKQMADKVLAKAYATTADGKEVATRKFYYSVEKYVSNKMKNTATKDSLKNVLASMVNYGAAAQNYFAYNTQHLADKLLYDTTIVTDENKKKLDSTLEGYQKTKEQMQQYIRTITEVENPKTRIAGIALDLKSTVSIRVIVPKDTTSADNKIAYTVGDGTAVKYLKLQNYDATYYYADITGIVAKNLDDMYHIYVCDASGNQISNIVNYGVMSYAIQKWESENEDLVNLVKKLQVYNVAAQKYFESK